MPTLEPGVTAPPGGDAHRFQRIEAWAALALALTLAGTGFARLIGAPYAYDDFSVLWAVSDWRGSQHPMSDLWFRPHNEHLIAGMRTLFALSTSAFGTDASWLRLILVACHGFGGWAVGCLVVAGGGSRTAAVGATVLYVTSAVTFAPSAVWYATGAVVMISWVAVLLGQAAIAQSRPGLGVALSLGGLLAGTTGALPGLAAPWCALVVQSREQRREGWFDQRLLGWAAGLGVVAVVVLVAVRTVYPAYASRPFPSVHVKGLPTAAILIGSAPGRLVQVFFENCPVGWAAAAGWSVVAIGFWLSPTRVKRLTGSTFLGAAMLALAVGLMRPEYALVHFEGADRYYYPLLAPICLAVAGLWTRVPDRWPIGGLLVIACAAPLWIGRERLVERFPASGLELYEAYWRGVEPLVRAIDEEAQSTRMAPRPWHLADGVLPGQRLPGGGLPLSVIVRSARPRLAGATFSPPTTPEDRARQNRILDRWADGHPEPFSPVCVVGETLLPATRPMGSWLDFSLRSGEESVVSGLEPWEQPYRFMTGAPTVLRLVSVPGEFTIRAWVPDLSRSIPTIEVSVSVEGHALGTRSFAARGGESEVGFPWPGGPDFPPDRTVEVVLRAAPSWRPIDHIEGNRDSRLLTMALRRLGFDAAREAGAPPVERRLRCSDISR